MPRFIPAIDEYVGRIKLIERQGVSLPKEWSAVHQRLIDYKAMTSPAKDRLIAAVTDPDSDEDIVGLRADAYGEAAMNAGVNNAVTAGVHATLRDIYHPHSQRIYGQLAKRFDAAAQKFAAACGVIDPEIDSRPLLTAPDEQRTAYTQAPLFATELSELLPALQAAAHFCGAEVYKNEPLLLPLVVDANGAHRRKVWTAWETQGGNTGRWGAIVKAGASIRAANLDTLRPYRKPAPMQERREERGGVIFHIPVDPEDHPSSLSAAG